MRAIFKPALSCSLTQIPDDIRVFTKDKFPLLAAICSLVSPFSFLFFFFDPPVVFTGNM